MAVYVFIWMHHLTCDKHKVAIWRLNILFSFFVWPRRLTFFAWQHMDHTKSDVTDNSAIITSHPNFPLHSLTHTVHTLHNHKVRQCCLYLWFHKNKAKPNINVTCFYCLRPKLRIVSESILINSFCLKYDFADSTNIKTTFHHFI